MKFRHLSQADLAERWRNCPDGHPDEDELINELLRRLPAEDPIPKGVIPANSTFDLKSGKWTFARSITLGRDAMPVRTRPGQPGASITVAFGGNGIDHNKVKLAMAKDGNFPVPSSELKLLPKPLEPGCYGILLSPRIVIGASRSEHHNIIHPQDIRDALLYWDQIAIPYANLLGVHPDPDQDFLEAEGVLNRPFLELFGEWDYTAVARKTFLDTFEHLIIRDNERWTMARSENSISFLSELERPEAGLSFRLFDAIPVPDTSVPLADILEFKNRRKAEIKNLQSKLADVYGSICEAPDKSLAESAEIAALQAAVADHLKVAREARLPFRLKAFEAKINKDTFSHSVGTYILASTASFSPLVSGLLGIAGGVFASLELSVGLRERRDRSTPYEYVSRIHSDLFCQ